jgi:glycine oxidase
VVPRRPPGKARQTGPGLSDLAKFNAIVVGQGVFGLAVAAHLSRAGARVVLVGDPAGQDNASAIAAGMLAPALESALGPDAETFAELAGARDLWPAFAAGLDDIGLEQCGAMWIAPPPQVGQAAERLSKSGAAFEETAGGLFTPEDWRLDPPLALAALRRVTLDLGGRAAPGRVIAADARSVRLEGGQILEADAVVLACGFGGLDLAPELSVLTPIKGQILKFAPGVLATGPILRGPAGYVVPGRSGAAAGATMEAGRSDLTLDPAASQDLRQAALALVPELSASPFAARAGIRAETPDRRALIGRSRTGAWLCAGARRNGWLLAPLAARLIAEGLAGSADAPAHAPGRFSL